MALTNCRECGGQVSTEATSCPHCGCPQPALEAEVRAGPELPSGNDPDLLPAVRSWNWGAFLLSPLWAFAHGLWPWGLAMLLLGQAPGSLHAYLDLHLESHGDELACALLSLVIGLHMGRSGNELAWRARRFRDLEEFQAVQRAWTAAGVIVLAVLVALLIIVWIFRTV